jgi:hypothetical protein
MLLISLALPTGLAQLNTVGAKLMVGRGLIVGIIDTVGVMVLDPGARVLDTGAFVIVSEVGGIVLTPPE